MKTKKTLVIYGTIATIIILAVVFYFSQSITGHKTKTTPEHIVTVKTQPFTKTLYFSGLLMPLETYVVYSPIEGDIKNINFTYGHLVKKGQILAKIESDKQRTNFEEALTDYLKAKQDFNTKYTTWVTTEKLYQEQLVSKDSRDQDKNSYYLSEISLMQSKAKLEILLNQQKLFNIGQLEKLTISDIQGIKKAFESNRSLSLLNITSPMNGIVLFEEKGDNNTEKLDMGSHVKENQVLFRVGDLTGLTISLKANEYDINDLKPGQTAIITSDAFPGVTMNGILKNVSQEAVVSDNNQPMFSAEVVVPKLTDAERKIIHIGMTVKVAIQLQTQQIISIPMGAIKQKKDKTFVRVINPTTGRHEDRIIKTGETEENSVQVISGLKDGEQILVAD